MKPVAVSSRPIHTETVLPNYCVKVLLELPKKQFFTGSGTYIAPNFILTTLQSDFNEHDVKFTVTPKNGGATQNAVFVRRINEIVILRVETPFEEDIAPLGVVSNLTPLYVANNHVMNHFSHYDGYLTHGGFFYVNAPPMHKRTTGGGVFIADKDGTNIQLVGVIFTSAQNKIYIYDLAQIISEILSVIE